MRVVERGRESAQVEGGMLIHKLISKPIDQKRKEVYNSAHGKSDRIKGPKKETNHGLYKRGSVWWMSFTHNGEQFRRSIETEDKKLATRIFDKLKRDIAEGKWFERLPGQVQTFTDLIEKYLKEFQW